MITGILVALPQELGSLTTIPDSIWSSKKESHNNCFSITERLLVVCSGAGAENAHTAAEKLVHAGAKCLISWGCAGGLDPALKSGDLVLFDWLIDANGEQVDMDASFSREVHCRLSSFSVKSHLGGISEASKPVSLSRDKIQIHKNTGALAIDMETIACAKVAKKYGLTFLAIRSIVDPVEMDLPEIIQHAIDTKGNILPFSLLSFMVLHPSQLPKLIKLALHFNAAKNSLKYFARHIDTLLFR